MVEDKHSRIGRGEDMLKEAMVEVEVEVVLALAGTGAQEHL